MARNTPITRLSDDPGGEIVVVEVYLNGKLVGSRSCTTVERVGNSRNFRYKVNDTDETITFQRDKGILELAETILKRI